MTLQVAAPNKLGLELIRRGLLTNEQLTKTTEAAEEQKCPISEILLSTGLVSSEDLLTRHSSQPARRAAGRDKC